VNKVMNLGITESEYSHEEHTYMDVVQLISSSIVVVLHAAVLTCGHYMEDARHGLGAQFVASPAQQGSIVALRFRLVSGNATPTAGL
jgi:hypothetical protein